MRHYCLDWPDLPAKAFQRAPGKNRPATLEGGGKGGGSAPSYPDPNTVAAATTATNTQTAAYNKALNLNNYSNPFGSQQTTQTGTDPTTGAPIYNTSISANPQLTAQLNGLLGIAGQNNGVNAESLNGMRGAINQYNGVNQTLAGYQGQLQGLGNSLSPSVAAQAQQQGQDAAYKAQTQYLDPQFAQQGESLSSQLANQGLAPGSEAYNNAMTNFNNTKQNAYSNASNQAIMTGSQLGAQNLQNQISGINTNAGLIGQQAGMSGMQASNIGQEGGLYGNLSSTSMLPYSQLQTIGGMIPGYSGTSQSAASPADIAGLYNNQYQSQLAGYNAQQSSSNSMMGGLFGLGSSALLAYGMSDRRAKRDIHRIGTWSNGLGVYTYRYMWEKAGRHIGFMADEVRKVAPTAVARFADGFDRVNYVLAVR